MHDRGTHSLVLKWLSSKQGLSWFCYKCTQGARGHLWVLRQSQRQGSRSRIVRKTWILYTIWACSKLPQISRRDGYCRHVPLQTSDTLLFMTYFTWIDIPLQDKMMKNCLRYPPVIKHGNGKSTIFEWFSSQMPIESGFPLPALETTFWFAWCSEENRRSNAPWHVLVQPCEEPCRVLKRNSCKTSQKYGADWSRCFCFLEISRHLYLKADLCIYNI